MKNIFIILSLITITVTNLYSQNISNAYSVYGFRAPFLKSGEFITTLYGSYSSYDYDYTYNDRPDYYNISEGSSMYAYARAIIAITDKLLINTTLNFYPKNDNNINKYGDATYDNKNIGTQNAYIYPSLAMTYRPVNNLEFTASVYGYTNDYSNKTVYSDPDQNPYIYSRDYKNFGSNFSVNYFGKLWNK